jgi:perosamine synthetase
MKAVLDWRRKSAELYTRRLKDVAGITLPFIASGAENAWFLYPLLIPSRDKVRAYLSERGVETNVSWPKPVYKQPFYKEFAQGVSCPVAEDFSSRVLCLPMFFGLSEAEQDYTVEQLTKALKELS